MQDKKRHPYPITHWNELLTVCDSGQAGITDLVKKECGRAIRSYLLNSISLMERVTA